MSGYLVIETFLTEIINSNTVENKGDPPIDETKEDYIIAATISCFLFFIIIIIISVSLAVVYWRKHNWKFKSWNWLNYFKEKQAKRDKENELEKIEKERQRHLEDYSKYWFFYYKGIENESEFGLIHKAFPCRNPQTAQQLIDTMEIRIYSGSFNRYCQCQWVFCLEDISIEEIAIATKWKHIFHSEWIQEYIRSKFRKNIRIKCPIEEIIIIIIIVKMLLIKSLLINNFYKHVDVSILNKS